MEFGIDVLYQFTIDIDSISVATQINENNRFNESHFTDEEDVVADI